MDTNTLPQTRAQLESPAEINKLETDPKRAEVLRWMHELQTAEKVFEGYHKRVDEIMLRYRDERTEDGARNNDRRYNALWSMKETLKPLLFGESPVPYITRWHDDDDVIGRDASLILQRLLSLKAGSDHFYDALSEAVDEYTLAGRGATWVNYLPEFAVRESDVKEYVDSEDEVPEDEFADVGDDESLPPYKSTREPDGRVSYRKKIEYKASETCILESVNTKDLLHGPATRWRHVPWLARRVPMLRDEAIKRFGRKIGSKLPLAAKEQSNPRMKSPNTDDFKGGFARAVVWEIWDKTNRKIIWICPDYGDSVLDKRDDMLELEGFFPCAKPIFGTMTNDTMIPVPDYTEWQDIALELDDVTFRIHLLIDALRVAGVYSEQYGDELKQILTGTKKNTMISVKNWAMFAEKGGLKGAVDFFPLDQVIQTLDKLYEVRARLVQEMYEITGISDIVRGASDPRETAAAQKMKGSFANARLTTRQKSVGRHARETLTIMAEIVCSLYSDETIMKLCNATEIFKIEETGRFDIARWKAAIMLLRNEPLRILRVKIDTESLAESAMMGDREEAQQFLTGISGYLKESVMMLQMAPKMGPLLGKMLKFAVRKFRVGRGLEHEISMAIDQLAKTGIGQPQEEGAAADPGMNDLEASIEREKIALDREKLELDKRRLGIEETKMGIQWFKEQGTHGSRQKDLGIKEFKAVQDVRLKEKQIDTTAQSQQQQMALQAQDQQQRAQIDEREMQHEQQMGAADLQMRHAEHQAGREDAAVGHQQQQEEFQAGREDRAHETARADRDFEASRKDAVEDRKIQAASVKAKAAASKAKPAAKARPKKAGGA